MDSLTGQRFLQTLNALFSTAGIHLDNNRFLQHCVDDFVEIIKELLRSDDEINLLASVGCFYLQQEKVMLQRNASGLAKKMLAYLEVRKIEGLRFTRSAAYVSHEEILAVVRIVNRAANEKDPLFWLQSTLEVNNAHWLEIIDTNQAQSLASIFSNRESGTDSAGGKQPTESGDKQPLPDSLRTPGSGMEREGGESRRKKRLQRVDEDGSGERIRPYAPTVTPCMPCMILPTD